MYKQRRLSAGEVNYLMTARKLKKTKAEIARELKVTEGAIRYRLKRAESGAVDGRKHRASGVDRYGEVIAHWVEENERTGRPLALKLLYEMLVRHHGYTMSYDALHAYLRKRYPELPRAGKCIRADTTEAQLTQIDWKEEVWVRIGSWDNLVRVNFLVNVLAFSRGTAVVPMEKRDEASLIHAQNECFRRLGGLTEWVRPDCMSTAIVEWHGDHSVLNERFGRYLNDLGVQVFPARPGRPTDKAKVERRIQALFDSFDFEHQVFRDMAHLQEYVDHKVPEAMKNWRCPATGRSVADSLAYERTFLRPLPDLFPAIPVKEEKRLVKRDGTVAFCGNAYQLPEAYIGKMVLCTHAGTEIVIHHEGKELFRRPYLPDAKGMLLYNPDAIETSSIPLSPRMKAWALDVARRQIDIYHTITTEKRP